MATRQPIRYWNRGESREEVEKVYGGGALRWLYETRTGRWLTDALLTRPWVSKLVGLYQSTSWSRRRVPSFIEEFEIPMEEFEVTTYRSFNDFFIRRFRPEARDFCAAPEEFPAVAEGRFLAYRELDADQAYPVKGAELTPSRLLAGAALAEAFVGGPLLIARLCPTDYHRFHYPDSGRTLEGYRIPGRLHSVNPAALRFKGDILVSNERQVSILETENFGRLAFVEVGAMNVGRIVPTHPSHQPFLRGGEKGYFLFGGSAVLLLGEPGRWRPDADLLERTERGQETFVRLGERIGLASSPLKTDL